MAYFYKSKDNKIHHNNKPLNEVRESPEEIHEEKPLHPVLQYFKRTTLKGLNGHSIYDVGKYFFRSMFLENLNIRATSLSFNFFTALFPALIFLLTLIAYLPIKGIKTQFIQQFVLTLTKNTY